jgi:hypothetical protein
MMTEIAALRDFNPAHVGCGSSGWPHRRQPVRSAKTGEAVGRRPGCGSTSTCTRAYSAGCSGRRAADGVAQRFGAKCRHKLNALQHAVAEDLPERYTQFAAAHESEHCTKATYRSVALRIAVGCNAGENCSLRAFQAMTRTGHWLNGHCDPTHCCFGLHPGCCELVSCWKHSASRACRFQAR